MSVGLNETQTEEVDKVSESELAEESAPSVGPERKTKTQRNKEKIERVKVCLYIIL